MKFGTKIASESELSKSRSEVGARTERSQSEVGKVGKTLTRPSPFSARKSGIFVKQKLRFLNNCEPYSLKKGAREGRKPAQPEARHAARPARLARSAGRAEEGARTAGGAQGMGGLTRRGAAAHGRAGQGGSEGKRLIDARREAAARQQGAGEDTHRAAQKGERAKPRDRAQHSAPRPAEPVRNSEAGRRKRSKRGNEAKRAAAAHGRAGQGGMMTPHPPIYKCKYAVTRLKTNRFEVL